MPPRRLSDVALSSPASSSLAVHERGTRPWGAPSGRSDHGGAEFTLPQGNLNAPLGAVLAAIARVFAPFVAAALAVRPQNDRDDTWIDQKSSPLGRRLHCVLARRGELPARKLGRRWLVRRTDLDAYIQRRARPSEVGPQLARLETDQDEASVRKLLAECGLGLVEHASPVASKRSRD